MTSRSPPPTPARDAAGRLVLVALPLYYADTSAVIKLLVKEKPDRGLRSRDAIHLATARILGEDLDAIVSYDDRLLKAATDAGLATVSPRD
jgi:predicted nucleic acid-binding protein